MNRVQVSPMIFHWGNRGRRSVWLGLVLAGLLSLPAAANEKIGMPDLCQIEQTCLPTATANLLVYFGQNGYPNLIAPGDSKEDGYIHTVHHIMEATDANFEAGTHPSLIVNAITKYVENAGYHCDVEFRGLGREPFSQDWLQNNNEPNKGFILMLAYCHYDGGSNTYTNAWNVGHAVTLVNAEPDMILVHDPAHREDQVGRKILTPQVLTGGIWRTNTGSAPVNGLLMLSGSMLSAPPNSQVMLIGAVCVTMHPIQDPVASSSPGSVPSATPTIGGNGGTSAPTTPAPVAPQSATKSWAEWIFNLLFSK